MSNNKDLIPDNLETFDSLYKIVKILRSPDGCPWDKKQTPLSLRDDLLEECFECIDAIEENDSNHIAEELGDVLLDAAMIIRIFEEQDTFTLPQVFKTVCEKLVRRHPHVFANEDISTPDAVVKRWEEIKKTEKSLNNEIGRASCRERV